eukprot:Stramenopile-MAST_4_protein_4598
MTPRKKKSKTKRNSFTGTTTVVVGKPKIQNKASHECEKILFDDLVVGHRYVCLGGKWGGNRDQTSKTFPADLLAIKGEKCYLHFVGLDKRLDEWVTIDRILYEDDGKTLCGDGSVAISAGKQGNKRKFMTADSEDAFEQQKKANKHRSTRHSVHSHGHQDPKTKVRNIKSVRLGNYIIDPWYYSPYPGKFGDDVDSLYICEFTFKYMLNLNTLAKHSQSSSKCPPGKMIYKDETRKLAAFEIPGKEHPVYCQNLCLFAKLFIEHKTLYYDVTPFTFYIVTEYDEDGHHPVAYYSKENHSAENYNLACILTFPPHQRKGYGRLLMSLSYEMSKRNGDFNGSPEKPLSDLGKLSYRSFWIFSILSFLREQPKGHAVNLEDIIQATGFKREDIISTIHYLGLLKHWKGQYTFHYTRNVLNEMLLPYDKRKFGDSYCKPECFLGTR